jgi:hypothetical protein
MEEITPTTLLSQPLQQCTRVFHGGARIEGIHGPRAKSPIANTSSVVSSTVPREISLQEMEGRADVILAVTCAIRDNAERKIWARLDYFRSLKKKRPRSKPPLRVGTVMYSILYVPLSI